MNPWGRWAASLRFRLLAATLALRGTLGAQNHEPFEDPPINYSTTVPVDAVSRLNAAMAKQAEEIRGWPARRRLRWLLEQLQVPVESQLLVFGKTSLQRGLISPGNPRALYFSDEAYVGWVPGGAIEITVFDPVLGATFYVLDAQQPETAPLIARSQECLLCHAHHDHTPSLRARSVFPDATGEPLSGSGSSNLAPDTPLEERWGGWYVTGRPSGLRHRGNVTGKATVDFTGDAGLRGEVLLVHWDSPPAVVERFGTAQVLVQHVVPVVPGLQRRIEVVLLREFKGYP
jgi:hypothetical protein